MGGGHEREKAKDLPLKQTKRELKMWRLSDGEAQSSIVTSWEVGSTDDALHSRPVTKLTNALFQLLFKSFSSHNFHPQQKRWDRRDRGLKGKWSNYNHQTSDTDKRSGHIQPRKGTQNIMMQIIWWYYWKKWDSNDSTFELQKKEDLQLHLECETIKLTLIVLKIKQDEKQIGSHKVQTVVSLQVWRNIRKTGILWSIAISTSNWLKLTQT